MNKIFKGIIPALITPLCEDNKTVNEKMLRELVEFHLGMGADGFYIVGSTGEGLLLTEEERRRVCEITVSQVKGRKPVIAHIAAMNFNEALRLARHAEECGADALSAIPPLFFQYTEQNIYDYYKTLAESTSLPFIMYNHTAVNGGMPADIVTKMFKEIDNITGVKWTVNNYFELMKLKDMTDGKMNVINGPDEMLISGLAAGADAGIGTTYNVMLPLFLEVYKNFSEGNVEEARKIQYKINRVVDCMIKYKVLPATKYMYKMMGFNVGEAVYPMSVYTDAEKASFEADLKEAGWQF